MINISIMVEGKRGRYFRVWLPWYSWVIITAVALWAVI